MKAFIKKIEKINFGLMSPENIRDMSVVTVEYPDTYGDDGFPVLWLRPEETGSGGGSGIRKGRTRPHVHGRV